MTTQTTSNFHSHLKDIKKLVAEHKKIKDEPLLLAIYYQPRRDPQDIFLFEVIDNFGRGAVSDEKEFFEVTYGSTSGFLMESGQRLHLILTNPEEFALAVNKAWPQVRELQDARADSQYEVIFKSKTHEHLERMLHE
jgi:hypothetical protein